MLPEPLTSRVPGASSAVFGAEAWDPGTDTVYVAKLATAQCPCDLRPKACSWPREWALQPCQLNLACGCPLLLAPCPPRPVLHWGDVSS